MTGNPTRAPVTGLVSPAAATVRRQAAMRTLAVRTTRSVHLICELAQMANCGYCWARPQHPCAVGRGGTEGYHLARFARAARRGLISATDFDAVLAAAGDNMFNGAAVVFDDTPGGPAPARPATGRSRDRSPRPRFQAQRAAGRAGGES